MTLEKYAQAAHRTSRKEPWVDHLTNGILGLLGECGEFVDLLKKWKFQSEERNAPLPVVRLIEELGDLMWYVAEFSAAAGIKLEDIPVKEPSLICDNEIGQAIELFQSVMLIALDGKDAAYDAVTEVVARVSYFAEQFCTVSLSEVLVVNVHKLEKRYPEGFDAERSTNRDENDC